MEVVVSQQGSKSTPNRAQEIVRAEMVRRRRTLTEEQESAIESLLLSTALEASKMIEPVLKFCSQPRSSVGDSADVVRSQ